jgi:hypothetical protein
MRLALTTACGLLFACVLTGCKQDEGERCQLDSDCSDGLLCCFGPGETKLTGGRCLPENRCVARPQDGAVEDGSLEPDIGPDGPLGDTAPPEDTTPLEDTSPDEDTTAALDTAPAPDTAPDVTPAPDTTSTSDTAPPADAVPEAAPAG